MPTSESVCSEKAQILESVILLSPHAIYWFQVSLTTCSVTSEHTGTSSLSDFLGTKDRKFKDEMLGRRKSFINSLFIPWVYKKPQLELMV